jgi:DNA polymerase iota
MDVSDICEYNLDLLNENDLPNSFFCLSKNDPADGFQFDASRITGHVYGQNRQDEYSSDPLWRRLMLGSHLASYLRLQMEEQLQYTCTVGISTSKLLSKLVGNVHKPQAQTTLLPPYLQRDGEPESNVTTFIDNHDIGKIPNIGFKMAHRLREYVVEHHKNALGDDISGGEYTNKVSVRQVRTIPNMGPTLLEKILGGSGMPRGVGGRTWQLLHGIDDTEVGMAKIVPQQISIEDSYIRLDNFDRVQKELLMLSKSLIKRMRADLTEDEEDLEPSLPPHDPTNSTNEHRRWLALPRTLRLSTRPRPPADADGTRGRATHRISRSIPAPNLLNNLTESVEELAGKLVSEHLVSLFRRLHPEKSGWDLSLINIGITNMMETAGNSKVAIGRDISKMFKNQDNHLKDWKVEDIDVPPDQDMEDDLNSVSPDQHPTSNHGSEDHVPLSQASQASYFHNGWDDEDEDVSENSNPACPFCQARMPSFAVAAHLRFHETED